MTEKIHGADTSKKITPEIVRDAIITCYQAEFNSEVESALKDGIFDEKKHTTFNKANIEIQIKQLFKQVGSDFKKPTKKGLEKVLIALQEKSSRFRNKTTVKKNADSIAKLMKLL